MYKTLQSWSFVRYPSSYLHLFTLRLPIWKLLAAIFHYFFRVNDSCPTVTWVEMNHFPPLMIQCIIQITLSLLPITVPDLISSYAAISSLASFILVFVILSWTHLYLCRGIKLKNEMIYFSTRSIVVFFACGYRFLNPAVTTERFHFANVMLFQVGIVLFSCDEQAWDIQGWGLCLSTNSIQYSSEVMRWFESKVWSNLLSLWNLWNKWTKKIYNFSLYLD